MSQKINTPEPEDGDSHDGPVVARAQLGSVLSPESSEGGLAALGLGSKGHSTRVVDDEQSILMVTEVN
jgi:hypothetical protein